MTYTVLDCLDGLQEFLDGMSGWCDQNGDYHTGIVSVSKGTVMRMRRLVLATARAYESVGCVVLPDGVSLAEYPRHGGETPLAVDHCLADYADSDHDVVDGVEVNGGKLHRFTSAMGWDVSAIYVNGVEKASEERGREEELVRWWNESHPNKA